MRWKGRGGAKRINYVDGVGALTGNRWVDTTGRSGLPGLTSQTPQAPAWYLARNQISGWTHDGAGNLTVAGNGLQRTFGYDAENRMTSATVNGVSATYVYDGDGQRVQKTVGSGTAAVTTTFVYDAFGNLAAEYAVNTPPSACGTATCFLTVDHLGSTRMVTDDAGVVKARYDYLPFGEELLAGTGGANGQFGICRFGGWVSFEVCGAGAG